MTKDPLDSAEIVSMYQILGVGLDASLDDVRKARNTLIKRFHPDKNPTQWEGDLKQLESHIHLVQTAFEYIVAHYQAIQDCLGYLPNESLSSRLPKKLKVHWIYSAVAHPSDGARIDNPSAHDSDANDSHE